MIGVADSAADKDLWVALHRTPSPAAGQWTSSKKGGSLCFSQAIGKLSADVNQGPTLAIKEFAVVRLAVSAAERFMVEHAMSRNLGRGRRDKEPFTLSLEGRGSAPLAVLQLAPHASFQFANELRFERLFGRHHAADRKRFGDAGHKPVSFVMTAEKFVFDIGQSTAVGWLARQQEQMAILRLRIEYEQVGIGSQTKVEILALPVPGDIDLNFARRESPTIGDEWPEFDPRPKLSEILLNGF